MKTKEPQIKVVRHNDLIHSRFAWTLEELRQVLFLLSKIQSLDQEFQTYRFAVKEYVAAFDLKSKDAYAKVRQVSKNLMKKVIEIPLENGDFLQVAWLASARY